MQKKRPYIAPLIAALAVLAAADASAMGFGKVPQSAVLGQALDFSVPLRLDPGEAIPPECVAADVTVGDQRLSPAQVRARVEAGDTPEATVRVVTLTAIDEPVVAVNVAVGCPATLSRRFVLLADPLPNALSAPLTYPVTATPADARTPAAPAAPERAPAAAPAEPDRPAGSVAPLAKARPKAAAPRPPRVAKAGGSTESAAPAPRLRLDAAEPVAAAPAPAAASATDPQEAELAAMSAAAAASAASAAADRIAALERSLETLRNETKADRDSVAHMRSRTAEAELMARWTPYLLVLVAALLLAVAWLVVKLRALNQERRQDWMKAVKVADEPVAASARVSTQLPSELPVDTHTPPPFIPTRPGPPLGMMAAAANAAAADDGEPEPWSQRTQRLPPAAQRDEQQQASRAVSIEELIDLEQQAEFFIVLGQEEAAIDLLVDHLRSTGGGSPLPYLKLLEIYKRRAEREAYDRTRARFNHRFNAVAPDWDDDVQQGRSLEDYPNIIARLQMAWPTPLDAMAELESLLFRKSRGELFDMPAYRDLLFLYSLSRDLLDREPVDSGNVDVLLPLSEGATFTEPMPLEDSPEGLPSGLLDFEAQPTVPVDLDLTQPAMPDSIFGDPKEKLRRR